MSSWTQVHVTGLLESALPSDEEIELLLEARYNLSKDDDSAVLCWAGTGTTLVKRQDQLCRGYCFLAFLSLGGATLAVERINNYVFPEGTADEPNANELLPRCLQAELSQPKPKKPKKKAPKSSTQASNHVSDTRLKRRRAPPTRKHPVIKSSAPAKK